MNPADDAWNRLISAARQAPEGNDVEAPYGFATRVVSMAFAQERPSISAIFENLSLRALGVASLLAVVALAANYSFFTGSSEQDASSSLVDPVSEVLDMTKA